MAKVTGLKVGSTLSGTDTTPTDGTLETSGAAVIGGTLTVPAASGILLGTDIITKVQDTTITSAQLLALNGTPKTVVTAPGAGLAVIPICIVLTKAAGTAYGGIAAGEDLAFKFTDGSGAECAPQVETTGFLDQTTAQVRVVNVYGGAGVATATITPVANAAVVIQLLVGEITTGDSDLKVRVYYRVVPTVL